MYKTKIEDDVDMSAGGGRNNGKRAESRGYV
jgi:hypothetical protein